MTLFDSPDFEGHEGVHAFFDEKTGLKSIIAVHSTARGPAAGGCRMWDYSSAGAALTDALRLSRGMSYKNAMADLDFGGGKAVIIGDSRSQKTPELFEAFGRAVDSLGGKYWTAEDVGVSPSDLESTRKTTRFVAGLEGHAAASGDPSPVTAEGVFRGVRLCVERALNRDLKIGDGVFGQFIGRGDFAGAGGEDQILVEPDRPTADLDLELHRLGRGLVQGLDDGELAPLTAGWSLGLFDRLFGHRRFRLDLFLGFFGHGRVLGDLNRRWRRDGDRRARRRRARGGRLGRDGRRRRRVSQDFADRILLNRTRVAGRILKDAGGDRPGAERQHEARPSRQQPIPSHSGVQA